jgi:hypothetical protein
MTVELTIAVTRIFSNPIDNTNILPVGMLAVDDTVSDCAELLISLARVASVVSATVAAEIADVVRARYFST